MSAPYAVEFRGLSKAFQGVYANREIDLRVRAGSIHAIVGENGAGKSTAMKMLYGMLKPDEGDILIRGNLEHFHSPHDAIDCGIGMVHQHFMLAEPYTVLENILVGDEGAEKSSLAWKWLPSFFRPMNRSGARRKLDDISKQYGLKVDWDARVEELTVGIHQRIEILKLLYRNATILILDEPTAVLTPQEVTELFVHLRKLKAEGKTILIITHKLKEVLELADEVTVFRAGQVTGHRLVSETNADDLASLMVGRKVSLRAETPPPPKLGAPVLELKDVTTDALANVSFEVRGGEIVGIAGVEGNGQSELLQIIAHPKDYAAHSTGTIRILGEQTLGDKHGLAAYKIKELGVGVVPEDRHKEGLLLDQPLPESFLLGLQSNAPFSKAGVISQSAVLEGTREAIQEYDIRPRTTDIDAGRLSGGNQQKLVIAREFQHKPKFLVVAQPTRGVDVGAIEFIHGRILRARAEGTGVLLVSSELDEVMALSDRILVMYEGEMVAQFARGEADECRIGLYMGGGQE